MTSLAERLLAEAAHLRPLDDEALEALRRAILVEDVLDVRLRDEQISADVLGDLASLQALPATHTSLD